MKGVSFTYQTGSKLMWFIWSKLIWLILPEGIEVDVSLFSITSHQCVSVNDLLPLLITHLLPLFRAKANIFPVLSVVGRKVFKSVYSVMVNRCHIIPYSCTYRDVVMCLKQLCAFKDFQMILYVSLFIRRMSAAVMKLIYIWMLITFSTAQPKQMRIWRADDALMALSSYEHWTLRL